MSQSAEQTAGLGRSSPDPDWIGGRAAEQPPANLESPTAPAVAGGETKCLFPSVSAAARSTVLALSSPGGHVLLAAGLGKASENLVDELEHAGRAATLVDTSDPDDVVAALTLRSQVLYVESLAQPFPRPVPINEMAAVAHLSDLVLVVDNRLLSPWHVNALDAGADLVVDYRGLSGDEGGHRAGLGVVSGLARHMRLLQADTATVSGWETLDALASAPGVNEGLDLMSELEATTDQLAEHLQRHPDVSAVHRPTFAEFPWARDYFHGFGGNVSFSLVGPPERAYAFTRALRLVLSRTEAGGSRSVLRTRAVVAFTHDDGVRRRGFAGRPLVQLSVEAGEDAKDLLRSVDDAMRASALSPAGPDSSHVPVASGTRVPVGLLSFANDLRGEPWNALSEFGVTARRTEVADRLCEVVTSIARVGRIRVPRLFTQTVAVGLPSGGATSADEPRAPDPIDMVLVALGASVATTVAASLAIAGTKPTELAVRCQADLTAPGSTGPGSGPASAGRLSVTCDVSVLGDVREPVAALAVEHASRYSTVVRTVAEPCSGGVVLPPRLSSRSVPPLPPACTGSGPVSVTWRAGAYCKARGEGWSVAVDQPKYLFGRDRAPNPVEYLLAALAAEAAGDAGTEPVAVSARLDLRGPLGIDDISPALRDVRIGTRDGLGGQDDRPSILGPVGDLFAAACPLSIRLHLNGRQLPLADHTTTSVERNAS